MYRFLEFFGGKSKLIVLLAIFGSAICQYLGANYQTDHSARQEIINQNGDYQGQYSYLDPTGSRVVVKYNAGKNGFNVISDDKIPAQQPQNYIQPQPQPEIPVNYQQSYESAAPVSYPQPEQLYQQFQQQQQQQQVQQSYYAQPQPQPAYQPEPYQPKFTKAIFTPASGSNSYPAATEGQVKAYIEALEEEQKEALKSVNSNVGKNPSKASAHVSVQSTHQGYSYNINL